MSRKRRPLTLWQKIGLAPVPDNNTLSNSSPEGQKRGAKQNRKITMSERKAFKPPESANRMAKNTTCDRCDGKHPTSECPYFKGERDDHPDARLGKLGLSITDEEKGPKYLINSRVVKQPGDGSCLFHSLAFGLREKKLSAVSGKQLRRKICDYMKTNPSQLISGNKLSQWIKWDANRSVRSYVSRMRGGAWGGGIEMAVLALMKKVEIQVFQKEDRRYKRISTFTTPKASTVITVIYQGKCHYDAIVTTDKLVPHAVRSNSSN